MACRHGQSIRLVETRKARRRNAGIELPILKACLESTIYKLLQGAGVAGRQDAGRQYPVAWNAGEREKTYDRVAIGTHALHRMTLT
jgi:hypothetical protein